MPTSMTFDALTLDDLAVQISEAAVRLGGTGGTGTGTTPPPPVVDPFPADPTKAPTSPEDSTIIIFNGKPAGPPYLRSSQGAIYQIPVDASGNAIEEIVVGAPGLGWFFSVNGTSSATVWTTPGVSPTPPSATELKMRQGQVYFLKPNWDWCLLDHDLLNMGFANNLVLPPAIGATPPPPPSMPADPVASSTPPGSSGKVILAGPSQTIKTLTEAVAAAVAGDTIKLDAGAVFAESVVLSVPLLIDAQGTVANPGTRGASFSGGAILDGSTFTTYAQGKGGLVPSAEVIIKGLEIRGFGLQEATTGATAGVRNTGSTYFFATLDNCYIHDNQDGAASGTAGGGMVWKLNNCFFADNGIGDGFSHNMYFLDLRVEITNCTSIVTDKADTTRITGMAGGGHALKTRCKALVISGTNYFEANDGSPIDIPDGTTAPFSISAGTTLAKPAAATNHRVFDYCAESTKNGSAGGKVVATFDAPCPSPFVQIKAGSVDFTGSTYPGGKVTNDGAGTAVGL